jgi:type I restriction enzyme R subunit
MSNEANTCRKYIVPKLHASGWDGPQHDYTEQYYFTDGKLRPKHRRKPRGKRNFADYLLLYNGELPLAVVEAKQRHKSPDDGLDQAKRYAQILGVKFAYGTNGAGIVEYDFITGLQSDVIEHFPTPDELWARLKASQGLNDETIAPHLPSSFDDVADKLLASLGVSLLSLSTQHQIVDLVDSFQTQLEQMAQLREDALKEFDALLPAILDKAFKGEL